MGNLSEKMLVWDNLFGQRTEQRLWCASKRCCRDCYEAAKEANDAKTGVLKGNGRQQSKEQNKLMG